MVAAAGSWRDAKDPEVVGLRPALAAPLATAADVLDEGATEREAELPPMKRLMRDVSETRDHEIR